MRSENPYRAAGTFTGPSYLEREADRKLRKEIDDNQRYPFFCAPRQSGKSSLIAHTIAALDKNSFRAAFVDLSTFTGGDYEGFMVEFLSAIALSAGLSTNAINSKELESTLSLWVQTFPQRLIIFVDEIDALLRLRFRAQFLGQVRSVFNQRAENEDLIRVQFVLSGAAHPSQLIQNPYQSPFNVGIEILLDDFSAKDVAKLTAYLHLASPEVIEQIAAEIFSFTNGAVYLTQLILEKLWQRAVDIRSIIGPKDIVDVIGQITEEAPQNIHFTNIFDSLRRNQALHRSWTSWVEGQRPSDDDVRRHLFLIGLSGEDRPIRNALYKKVFCGRGPLNLLVSRVTNRKKPGLTIKGESKQSASHQMLTTSEPQDLTTPVPQQAMTNSPSPYATGGGGITLEQRYGATVLAALLLQHSVPGLGDDFAVERVQFQASAVSPIDDLLVVGRALRSRTLIQRTLAIGVRRNPTIGPSDPKFVGLMQDALATLRRNEASFKADTHRLSIVVAAPHAGAYEVSELAQLARGFPTWSEFDRALNTSGRTSVKLKQRFEWLIAAVAAADGDLEQAKTARSHEETWQLLRALWIHQCRLEGDDADRTHCIQLLRTVVSTPSEAETLFEHLCMLSANFSKIGAVVDQSVLRRALSGRIRIAGETAFLAAARTFAQLAQSLRGRTPRSIKPRSPAVPEIRLDRAEARNQLLAKVRNAATTGGLLTVTGEPGTGKSALVLDAIDSLTKEGAAVTMLNLRDLGARSSLELNQVFEASLSEALASTPVSELRILVLDGCEVVQEGMAHLVGDFARAADAAGLSLVAITRQDALESLLEILRGAWHRPLPDGQILKEFVGGFSESEIDEFVATAPALRSLADNSRSRWLLRLPGLLRLVLESDALDGLSVGPLSEAVVYRLVWKKLVRRGERHGTDGATPDGREAVAKALARRLLIPEDSAGQPSLDARELPSLRSDGVLLPVSDGIAWRRSEEFASDLLRDIAVFHVLLDDFPKRLLNAGVPRWALNATRVTVQALLHEGIISPPWRLADLLAVCRSLAEPAGERWLDLPWEAALTVPDGTALLERNWPLLSAAHGEALQALMRVVGTRFGTSLVVNADAGASVVALLCGHYRELESLLYRLDAEGLDLILRWLRGLAIRGLRDVSSSLRVRVRDEVLLRSEQPWDEDVIEALALLGPDLDADSEQQLRGFISSKSSRLQQAVESIAACVSLAQHHPNLLLELASAYYIEPVADNRGFGYRGIGDDGIRDHSARHRGFAAPLASWTYGPFWQLLISTVGGKTVAFINQLLNHAARFRVNKLSSFDTVPWRDDAGVEQGIVVNFPMIGERQFIGDSHVWRWYRGSGVGPYPCMSALLALEQLVERLFVAGLPLDGIVHLLLTDADSLAMAGLVYGFLVRHIDEANELLLPWLETPEIWKLESRRRLDEHSSFRFAEASQVANEDRRRWDCVTVAYHLVCNAIIKGDRLRIEKLAKTGAQLVLNAQNLYANSELVRRDPRAQNSLNEDLPVFQRWASMLNAANYQLVEGESGRVSIEYIEPPEIVSAMARGREDTIRGQFLWRLQATYALDRRSEPTADDVSRDLDAIEEILRNPPQSGPPMLQDGPAALALATIELHTRGRATFTPERIELAIDILLDAVANRPVFGHWEDVSLYSIGADRSAARALPLVLTANFDHDGWTSEDWRECQTAVAQALTIIATGPVIETRVALAEGLRALWKSPCLIDNSLEGSCSHRVALEIIVSAIRHCRLRQNISNGHPEIASLDGPIRDALSDTPSDEIYAPRLEFPIGALGDCVASGCCVADEAYEYLGEVVETYSRALPKDKAEWERPPIIESRPLVARSLLLVTDGRGPALLFRLLRVLGANPPAAAAFLHDSCLSATYDINLRRIFRSIWPSIMDNLLTAWEPHAHDQHWWQSAHSAVVALIPRPRPRAGESDVDRILAEAYLDWVAPSALTALVDRWINIRADAGECSDAIAWFLLRRPMKERISFGLPWIERIVGGRFASVAGRTWILWDWVKEIVESKEMSVDDASRLRRLVDGVAAQGNRRALELQAIFDEHV